MQITQSDFGMDDFYFLACLTEAPEALITNRNSDVVSVRDIVADAREKGGVRSGSAPASAVSII